MKHKQSRVLIRGRSGFRLPPYSEFIPACRNTFDDVFDSVYTIAHEAAINVVVCKVTHNYYLLKLRPITIFMFRLGVPGEGGHMFKQNTSVCHTARTVTLQKEYQKS